MVCGVPEDASRRGAAPTGAVIFVGAPPRGEAYGLRCSGGCFAAGRRSYRGRRCLWCLRRSPAPGRSVWLCGALAIRREARLLQGRRCLWCLCRSPAPGRSFWLCGVPEDASRRGAAPTGGCDFLWEPRPGAKRLVVRCSCDSPRGAAPTGGGGACGACVGAPPRGEALAFAVLYRMIRGGASLLRGLCFFVGAPPRGEAYGLRCSGGCFAAGRRSYRGRRCLWCLRRSPAPGRSVWLCGVLAIRREARLLQGRRCLWCLCRSPAPGRSFWLCSVLAIRREARLLQGRRCLWCLCRSPAPGRSVWLCSVLAIRREARLLQGRRCLWCLRRSLGPG
jgi:hypothetical protein